DFHRRRLHDSHAAKRVIRVATPGDPEYRPSWLLASGRALIVRVRRFEHDPHVAIFPGDRIEVVPILPIPGG
ncbi:MAG TPA: hypothetical protein VMT50_04290, partial [Steroidobacteraceae bacterium]|nr:hypothetical protein [Steroidobacteraceae bacterium]